MYVIGMRTKHVGYATAHPNYLKTPLKFSFHRQIFD